MNQLLFRTLVLGLFALTACQNRGMIGNAEGYNGGDEANLKLQKAGDELKRRLSDIDANFLPSRICNPDECSGSQSSWCRIVQTFSIEEQTACREYLVDNLEKLIRQEIPLTLRFEPISVPEAGGSRPVDAQTELSESGDIFFDIKSVQRMSSAEIQVVLLHERFHKIRWRGSFPTDEGSFGRDFLDKTAAAVMAYSERTNIEGFFFVEDKGYYGNDTGHYCWLANWGDWVRAGGPENIAEILFFNFIPSTMINDGTCVVP